MTANEMVDKVLLGAGRVRSRKAPGYSDARMSDLLNTAQLEFIKQTLSPKVNEKREGFEETEARAQGLGELIRSSTGTVSTDQTGVLPNGKFYDLPADFMYTILEYTLLDQLHCVSKASIQAPVYPATHNEYNLNKDNPYKKPFVSNTEGLVWRVTFSRATDFNADVTLATSKRHELVGDGTLTIKEYHIRYLRFPPAIVVDLDTAANQRNCVLDEGTHEAIVGLAVKRLKSNTDRQHVVNSPGIEKIE